MTAPDQDGRTRLLEGGKHATAEPTRTVRPTEMMPENRLLDQPRRSLPHRVARTRAQKDRMSEWIAGLGATDAASKASFQSDAAVPARLGAAGNTAHHVERSLDDPYPIYLQRRAYRELDHRP